ncbi:MAG: hypothetical protein MMC33_002356 [Icmadophila ericetorum]|nr:hypothetical protein [Icmadophila ericetorum]
MKTRTSGGWGTSSIILLGLLSSKALASSILSSSGFTNCQGSNSTIQVYQADVSFDRDTLAVTFDVSGTSDEVQNVTASLSVTAYGEQVYQKSFNPCDPATLVVQLCPVPAGTFAAQGTQTIPASFASQIPSIAFTIPDLDGQATLQLTGDGGQTVACIQSGITNGKTFQLPAVSYTAVGIAGAALLLTGLSGLGSAGVVGAHPANPSFGTIFGWFQSIAFNGAMSVNYPPIYRSFAQNFAFSTGLIPWNMMQTTIDNFRQATGGNLTDENVQFLHNATFVYTDGSTSANATALPKRSVLDWAALVERQLTTNVNGTSSGPPSTSSTAQPDKISHLVSGIQAFVEPLFIPKANTFMTVLLIFAIIIGAIAVGILLFKTILELWSLFGSFPQRLTGFRKRYWLIMAKTITSLILLLYGVWTLYCIYQFTQGDSWAAKLLAGVTLGAFTAILGFFTIRIFTIARKARKIEGDVSALYENKDTWIKYSLFYDVYKKNYFWIFVPAIVYSFAKGVIIAAGDGHGLFQSLGQLIIEAVFLILLLFTRPYATKSGNWINIVIQVVRVISVVCVLIFVEQLGIAQTTKTVTGVVLIAVQASLTGVLALLIAINAIIVCCKTNPHRRRRKEAEKLRELDLTPLDPRDSILLSTDNLPSTRGNTIKMNSFNQGRRYDPVPNVYGDDPAGYKDSTDNLVSSAASMGTTSKQLGGSQYRNHSPPDDDWSYSSRRAV